MTWQNAEQIDLSGQLPHVVERLLMYVSKFAVAFEKEKAEFEKEFDEEFEYSPDSAQDEWTYGAYRLLDAIQKGEA